MVKRLGLIVSLCLALLAFAPGALCVDESVPNEEALAAARNAIIPEGLTGTEADIFRQGYALGYYMALHPQDTVDEYVLNTSTHKFHYPSCQSAASIAPGNRSVYHGSREDLIEQGYKPCGVCKP